MKTLFVLAGLTFSSLVQAHPGHGEDAWHQHPEGIAALIVAGVLAAAGIRFVARLKAHQRNRRLHD